MRLLKFTLKTLLVKRQISYVSMPVNKFKFFRSSWMLALAPTLVYSLRWANCLPGSGKMPVLDNWDRLGFFARYLFYSKERIQFPLGQIQQLSYPFSAGNISRGSIPWAAILLKLGGIFFQPLKEFYFFPLLEMIGVFLGAYFISEIFIRLKVKDTAYRAIAVFLVALSPTLLFRSSEYFPVTFVFLNFPIYLFFALNLMKFYQNSGSQKNTWTILCLILTYPLTASTDYYLYFATLVFSATFLVISFINFRHENLEGKNKTRIFTLSLLFGILLAQFSLWCWGNQDNLEPPSRLLLFNNRINAEWGYGGGYGGGFHVSDLAGIFMASPFSTAQKFFQSFDPPLIDALHLPLISKKANLGQYEGYCFIGTILVILLILISGKTIRIEKNRRSILNLKVRLNFLSIFWSHFYFTIYLRIFLSVLVLWTLSWGYVIHLFGVPLFSLMGPSVLLSLIIPKLMFARSLGRLAIPFSLFVSVFTLTKFYSHFYLQAIPALKNKKFILITLIALIHVWDIHGFLSPPVSVTQGNDLRTLLSSDDQFLLKNFAKNKSAVIFAPAMTDEITWNRICYSIGFLSNLPVHGATVVFGEKAEQLELYKKDISNVLAGNFSSIKEQYSNVLIVVPREQLNKIMINSNLKLETQPLKSVNAVLIQMKET